LCTHRLDFSLAKVADRGVADRLVVDERVADGCVADGRVFCKQDPRKKQRLAFGSQIDLNRRSQAVAIKIRSGAHGGLGGGWNHRREARRRRFD
jgi:hypothetical protein